MSMTISMLNAVIAVKSLITTKDNARLVLLFVPIAVRNMKPIPVLKQDWMALFHLVLTVRGTVVLKDMHTRQRPGFVTLTSPHKRVSKKLWHQKTRYCKPG